MAEKWLQCGGPILAASGVWPRLGIGLDPDRIQPRVGGGERNRTADAAFAEPCLTTWLLRHLTSNHYARIAPTQARSSLLRLLRKLCRLFAAVAPLRGFAAAQLQAFGDEPPPDAQPSTSRVIKSCPVNIRPTVRRFCRLSGCHGSGASLRVCRSARLYYSRRAQWRDSLSG